uniref:EGF-like domain-containing protein n=1 Tax=Rhabditophanes sp. KR3021 TaxID=114890 RepID=A0AC35TYS8_9BILA
MQSFQIELSTLTASKSSILLFNSSGISFPPDSIETDDEPFSVVYFYNPLPPGEYKLIPSTDVSTACYIYINAIVGGDIKIGFVPHDDHSLAPERNDFPIDNLFQNRLNTIVAQRINIQSPGSIAGITLFQGTNMMSRPRKMSMRYGCTNEYYYSSIRCNDLETYFIKVDGFDFFGNQFRRVKTFSCEVDTETTKSHDIQTTQSPFVPLICLNNGTLVTDPKTNSQTCFCQGAFYGATCGTSYCFNDGINLNNGECLCKPSFDGPNCQSVTCVPDSGLTINEDYYTPVFVIRVRNQMADVIYQLQSQLSFLKQNFADNQKWFQNFGVVYFNNGGQFFQTHFYSSVEDFINSLADQVSTEDTSGGCDDTSFAALSTALSIFMIGNKSPVYVLADALPSDYDLADLIAEYDSIYMSAIYFLYLVPTNDTCHPDFFSPGFKAIQRIAHLSGGNVFIFEQQEYDSVGDFISNHFAATYFKTEAMYMDNQDVCSNSPKKAIIAVDKDEFTLALVATGTELVVKLVKSANSQEVNTDLTIAQDHIYIYTVSNLKRGNYEVSISSSVANTFCELRVYSNVIDTSNSLAKHYRVTYGFTTMPQLDMILRQPVFERHNSFVLRMPDLVLPPNPKLQAELTIYAETYAGRNLVFAANGNWRDHCDFNFYFPPMICHTANQIMYFNLFVSISDDTQIQRTGALYCAYTAPQPSGAPSSCQNGGIPNSDKTSNATCICSNMFSGKYCEHINCLNGGTSTKVGCECPAAVSGQFCEVISCPVSNTQPPQFKSTRSLVFVLDLTFVNRAFLSELSKNSVEMARDVFTHSVAYVDKVFVIGYDDKNVMIIGTADRTNTSSVGVAFKAASKMASQNKKACVVTRQWDAIDLAQSISEDGSIVYLFASSLPDEVTDLAYDVEVAAKFIQRRITFIAWVASLAKDAYYCTGTDYHFKYTKLLATESLNGQYFQVSSESFGSVISIVPTFIDDNIVYKKKFENCTEGSCMVWIPVDSHTQNIIVKIQGPPRGYSYEVNDPNGDQYYPYAVIVDAPIGMTIVEMRVDCPDGSIPFGHKDCVRIFDETDTWGDAQDVCGQNGGFIIDSLSPGKQALLNELQNTYGYESLWIGLNSLEEDDYGFSWDRGYNPTSRLEDGDYTNWDKAAIINDLQYGCVYNTANGTWMTALCNDLRSYVCQTSRYNDVFNPDYSESELLPRGKWIFTIQEEGSFEIEVRIQSNIKLSAQFVNDIHSDFPVTAAIGNSNLNRAVTHITQLNEGWVVATLSSTLVYSTRNDTLIAAAAYQKRQSCSYQFVSQNFYCDPNDPNQRDLYMIHSGVDEYSYPFQRMTFAKCLDEIVSCGHGVLINGQCICEDLWSGFLCDIPLCQNGGIIVNNNKCTCPADYDGEACQFATCPQPSDVQFTADNKTFVLILENTAGNALGIADLKLTLPNILEFENGGWFNEYVLVTFDSHIENGPIVYVTTDLQEFLQAFKNVNAMDPSEDCIQPVFDALIYGMSILKYPQSVIYAVVRGLPNNVLNENVFIYYMNLFQPQIFIHFADTKGTCKFDLNETFTRILHRYALASNGNIIPTEKNLVGSAFSVVMQTLHHGAVVANPSRFNEKCVASTLEIVNIDYSVTLITIIVYGNFDKQVTAKDGQNKDVVLFLVFEDMKDPNTLETLAIYQTDPLTSLNAGSWTFNIGSAGTCMSQIRTTGSTDVYTGYVPYFDSTPDSSMHLDNATLQPSGKYNTIVGTVSDLKSVLTYVEMYNIYSSEFQYLKFQKRDGCAYQYATEQPFKCSLGQFLIKYFGVDRNGYGFVRDGSAACTDYIWQPTQSTSSNLVSTTTQMGGLISSTQANVQTTMSNVGTTSIASTPSAGTTIQTATQSVPSTKTPLSTDRANLYIILDTSAEVPSNIYGDKLTEFWEMVLSNFQVDSLFINVAVGASAGNNDITAAYPVFNGFTSVNQLINAIGSDYTPIQSDGQDFLITLLGEATNQNFLNTGYDANAFPHILFYVTTDSFISEDALDAANQIKNLGTFKIVVIAYEFDSDTENYYDFADCVYTPQGIDDLNSLAVQLAGQIRVANKNGAEIVC